MLVVETWKEGIASVLLNRAVTHDVWSAAVPTEDVSCPAARGHYSVGTWTPGASIDSGTLNVLHSSVRVGSMRERGSQDAPAIDGQWRHDHEIFWS